MPASQGVQAAMRGRGVLISLGGVAALLCGAFICASARGQIAPPRVDRGRPLLLPGDVDTERSRVFVRIGATGLGHEHGAAARLTGGNIQLGSPREAGQLVFDMASFVAETPESRKVVGLGGGVDESTRKKVTENMLGSDVLDVKQYPQAEFRIVSASALPNSRPAQPLVYQLNGRFTLHGQTRALQVNARAEPVDGLLRLRGQFKIRQTDYGIKPYAKLLGAVGVADELTVWGEIWLWPAAAIAVR